MYYDILNDIVAAVIRTDADDTFSDTTLSQQVLQENKRDCATDFVTLTQLKKGIETTMK